jgi:hypothetical protein
VRAADGAIFAPSHPIPENAVSTVPNHALRQLRAGKLAVGLGLRQARTVDIAQIAHAAVFAAGQPDARVAHLLFGQGLREW